MQKVRAGSIDSGPCVCRLSKPGSIAVKRAKAATKDALSTSTHRYIGELMYVK